LSEAKSIKEKSTVKLLEKEESIIMSEVQSKKDNSVVINKSVIEKHIIASEVQSKKDDSILNISKKENSFISYSQSKKEIEKEKSMISIQPEKEKSLVITPTEPEKEKSIIITQPIDIIKEDSIIKSNTPIQGNPVILPIQQRTNLPRPKPIKTAGPQVMIRNFDDQEPSDFSYTPY
jgi:tRNA G10  N-methylase Trm11